MFEDSTFESTGRIRTRSRGWAMAAFVLNSSILAALIIIPLIYPEALPKQWTSYLLATPPPPPELPKPVQPKPTQEFHGRPEMTSLGLTAPIRIPPTIREITGERPSRDSDLITMEGGPAGPGDSNPFAHGQARPEVRQAVIGPQHISTGVAEGMVLQRTPPRYPPIAVAARIQGTVVLQATISTEGTIKDLHVLGGPVMLQQAAMEAVGTWRYRPYLLDGKPVEVEFTVNVIFSLGSR